MAPLSPLVLQEKFQREYESLRAVLEDARNTFFKLYPAEPENDEEAKALRPAVRVAYESWIKASEAYAAWEEKRFDYSHSLRKKEHSDALQ